MDAPRFGTAGELTAAEAANALFEAVLDLHHRVTTLETFLSLIGDMWKQSGERES